MISIEIIFIEIKGEVMSTRREFLLKTIGFVGVGVTSALANRVSFDNTKDISVAKTKSEIDLVKNKNELESAEAYAMCSYGSNCSGGGGSCSYGSNCGGDGGGGGGTCSYGSSCSGGGGMCSYGSSCGGS
jgi:hypothetical protein